MKWAFHTGVLLRLRLRREQVARQSLAATRKGWAAAREATQRLQAALNIHNATARTLLTAGGDRMNLRIYQQTIAELDAEMGRQRLRMAQLEQQADRQRRELTEAIAQRKALSILRDRLSERQREQLLRADAAEQDEVAAAMRHQEAGHDQ